MSSALFTRTYCGKQLQWWILQDECDLDKAPDLVFQDDPSFSPLTESRAEAVEESLQQQLLQLLRSWRNGSRLESLIGVLLALYAQHNKARICDAVTDERILFELSMLDELGCTEVLLTGGDGTGPQQVRFALPVPADTAPAQQLLSCIHKLQRTAAAGTKPLQEQRQQQQREHPHAGQHQQQEQQAEDEQRFVLTVSFPIISGSSSHIPVLFLRSPAWFSSQLPPMSLPAWDPHTSLLEYVPHLAERVTRHLSDTCPTAAARFMLFEGLTDLLGPPLEVNMSLLNTTSTTSSSSSSGGAGASTAGSRAAVAAGSAAGVWQVLCDQQPLLLFVELPRSYPNEAPVLSLQHLRRAGSDDFAALPNLPWSPRWPVDEQVARLFNFLKLQAAKASMNEPAAGAGVGMGPPGSSSSGMSPAAAASTFGSTQQGGGSLPPSPGFYS